MLLAKLVLVATISGSAGKHPLGDGHGRNVVAPGVDESSYGLDMVLSRRASAMLPGRAFHKRGGELFGPHVHTLTWLSAFFAHAMLPIG